MPTFVSGCWGVATRVTGVTYIFEREKLTRGGVGVGGRGVASCVNLELHEAGSWNVSHAQTESQRPHI
jgi:hypothetical protein